MKRGTVREVLDERYTQVAAGILLFAAALRLYALDARMLHFDEGQVLYFVHLAIEDGEWSYSPALHGPLMFHTASVIIRRLGDAAVLFRIPAVLFGVGITATPLLMRRELGDRASLASAALLATSPLMLYYTRFFRSDPALLFFSSVSLVAAIRFHRTRRNRYLLLLGLAAGFASTTKENFPLEIGMTWLLLAALLMDEHRGEEGEPRERAARAARSALRRAPWVLLAALAAYGVFVALYAPRPIPLDPAALAATPLNVLYEALGYWAEHSGGDTPLILFYSALLAIAEPLILVTGLAGAYFAIEDRRGLHLFLAAWVLIDLVAYSFVADGRMPWLGIYSLYPLALLAGSGLDRLIRMLRETDAASTRALALATVILLSGHAYQSVGSNYVWYDDASGVFEMDPLPEYEGSIVVQWAQPDDGAKEIVETIRVEGEKRHGPFWRDLRIHVISNESLMHPMPWYLHEYRNVEELDDPQGRPPVVLVPGEISEDVVEEVEDYETIGGHLTPGDSLTMYFLPVNASADPSAR